MVNIENIYSNYHSLIEEFGIDTIKDRYKIIYAEIQEFFSSIKSDEKLHIDEVILMHAILDFFTDVSRLKNFHKIQNVNSIKNIAYESFWLLRRKPIQTNLNVPNSNENVLDDKLAFSNEKFVFSRIASFLVNNSGKIDLYNELNSKVFSNYLDTLYYFLKYRDYDAQMIEIMIMGFQAGVLVSDKK